VAHENLEETISALQGRKQDSGEDKKLSIIHASPSLKFACPSNSSKSASSSSLLQIVGDGFDCQVCKVCLCFDLLTFNSKRTRKLLKRKMKGFLNQILVTVNKG